MLRKGTLALCLISKSLHFKITAMTRTPALRLSEVVTTLAWGLKQWPDVMKLFTFLIFECLLQASVCSLKDFPT